MKAFASFLSTAAVWALLFQQGLGAALEARQAFCEPFSFQFDIILTLNS
jgi:hypothetical protein